MSEQGKPGERIKEAEREISRQVTAVLDQLYKEIGMFPTDVEVDVLSAATYDKPHERIVGGVRLRF